jgi:putative PIN family toxin of toxin-antitoxin system
MIVVVDSNVWISALHFSGGRGNPGRAVDRAIREGTIATCSQIEDETIRILAEKFGWSMGDATERLDGFLAFALRVEISGSLHVCRDPTDDMVLECAVASGAKVIVTGDKDLPAMNPYGVIQIVTPGEFVAMDS